VIEIYLYRLYNNKKEIIYIGKTKNNPKLRIRTHFSNYKMYNNEDFWREEIRYFDYTELSKVDVDIYEIYLINQIKPKYNKEFKYIKGKSNIILQDLKFTELESVEDIGINVDYYKEIYDKIKLKNERKFNKYTIHDYRKAINLIEQNVYNDVFVFENLISNGNTSHKLRDLTIFQLIVYCGLKTNEVANLKVSDFNPKKQTIYLSNRNTEIPVTKKISDNLFNFFVDRDFEESFLFKTQVSDSITDRTIQNIVKSHFGVLATPNKFRNIFIINSVKTIDDFQLLSEILGISKNSIYKYLDKESILLKKFRKKIS